MRCNFCALTRIQGTNPNPRSRGEIAGRKQQMVFSADSTTRVRLRALHEAFLLLDCSESTHPAENSPCKLALPESNSNHALISPSLEYQFESLYMASPIGITMLLCSTLMEGSQWQKQRTRNQRDISCRLRACMHGIEINLRPTTSEEQPAYSNH